MAKTKNSAKKLTFLAHFVRGTGTSTSLAGGQEVKAYSLEEAWRIGKGLAEKRGFTLSDVTGPEEEDV